MTAPIGATVRIYVDLSARVAERDIVETTSGRRYQVIGVRVQQRGKHAGRQHLVVIVVPPETTCDHDRVIHSIRWYARAKRRR